MNRSLLPSPGLLVSCFTMLGALTGCGGASQLGVANQPDSGKEGSVLAELAIEIQNDAGERIEDAEVSVSLALGENPTDATLSGRTTVTSRAGVARFTDLVLNQAGEGFTIVASAEALSSVETTPFDVESLGIASVSFSVAPGETVAGEPLAVEVTLLNNSGAPALVDADVVVSLRGGADATLNGTTTRQTAAGVVGYDDLFIEQAGEGYRLVASVGSYKATSEPFTVVPAAPAQVGFTRQPEHVAAGQTLLPVEVAIQDEFGNPVGAGTGDVSLTLDDSPAPGAILAGTTTRALVAGRALFEDLQLDEAGVGYTLDAAVDTFAGIASAPFDVRAYTFAYTEPAPGGVVRLTQNVAESTPTRIVFDVTMNGTVDGYAAGMNLPLQGQRVHPRGEIIQQGDSLDPGTAPAAITAALGNEGRLANVFTSGLSQKAAGAGAQATDRTLNPGDVLYTLAFDLDARGGTGTVFDGANLPERFYAAVKNKAGADVVAAPDFALGTLTVEETL